MSEMLRVVIAEDNYLVREAYAVCWKTLARSTSWPASVMRASCSMRSGD